MSETTGTSAQSLGAIVMDGVRKGYGDDWSWQQVIESVSLDLPPGQFTAVVGPSGCGKTTLVNLLAGCSSGWAREGSSSTGARFPARAGSAWWCSRNRR